MRFDGLPYRQETIKQRFLLLRVPKEPPMSTALRWTSADLAVMPDNDKRYEIIDGELYVSRQPHWHHQRTSGKIFAALETWSMQTGAGEANLAPGLIFAEDDDVVPDVVWISSARRASILGADGHLHAAPELVVEVLSPGAANERRDREAKLKLYSRRGVLEYWIVDWRTQQVEVYRREELALRLAATLYATDTLTSPLLSGFACAIATLF
jgi:Uma2 family endonuclease